MHHLRMSLRLVTIGAVLALAGCAAGTNETSPATTPDVTAPAETASPTPQETIEVTPETPPGDREELTGTLGMDSIEGGCAYLEVENGTRYEIMWPEGWSVDGGGTLFNPEGQAVAGPGDEVTVRGAQADGFASICQIGPIFAASEVSASAR